MDGSAGTNTAAAENQMLCFHKLGTPQEEDVVLLVYPDNPKWRFSAEVTDDARYLVVYVYHLDALCPHPPS